MAMRDRQMQVAPLRPGIMIITMRPSGYRKKSELAGAGDEDQRVVLRQ